MVNASCEGFIFDFFFASQELLVLLKPRKFGFGPDSRKFVLAKIDSHLRGISIEDRYLFPCTPASMHTRMTRRRTVSYT